MEPYNTEQKLANRLDPLPPSLNSINHDIDTVDAPALLNVLEQQILTDNTIKFNGVFSGADQVSIESTLHLSDPQSPNLTFSDEISVLFRGKTAPFSHKLNIKGNKMKFHSDFGHSFMKIRIFDINLDSWLNPYVHVDSNRFLNKFVFGVGLLSVTPNWGHKNSKILFYRSHSRLEADMVTNGSLKYKDFFLNYVITNSLFTPWITNQRTILLGVNRPDFVAALKLEKNKHASYLDWNLDNLRLMFAYDLRRQGILGFEVFKNLLVNGNPRFGLGYQYVVNKDLLLKSKLDSDLTSTTFVDYTVAQGLSLQASASTNLSTFTSPKGFLDSPFAIGLKFILNR